MYACVCVNCNGVRIAFAQLGRVGTPEEVAEAIFFLATQSGFITGANVPIDGGRICLGAR